MGRRQDRKNTRKISQATGRSTVYFPHDTHSDDSARPSVAAFLPRRAASAWPAPPLRSTLNETPRNLRRRRGSALIGASLLGGFGSTHSADLTVKLTGDQEVPAVTTSATGTGTIVIKSDKSVSGSITTVGIEETMAHIHLAPSGTNRPPIVALVKTSENVWSVPDGSVLTIQKLQRGQSLR